MNNPEPKDFIRQIIGDDIESGKHDGKVVTRFPPEPNGFLHVGHAKSICLNFGVAEENGGKTFLRFDDTNPGKERKEYVDAIKEDVRWLVFDWGDRLTHASDYFDQLYEAAEKLIEMGKAYVDSLSAEKIREYRGSFTDPGKTARSGSAVSRKISICFDACVTVNLPTASTSCVPGSTWGRTI